MSLAFEVNLLILSVPSSVAVNQGGSGCSLATAHSEEGREKEAAISVLGLGHAVEMYTALVTR